MATAVATAPAAMEAALRNPLELPASPGRGGIAELSLCDDITTSGELDWGAFHRWISCLAVVTFDLEAGQAIEAILPEAHNMAEADLKSIRLLSFPDSNAGCMGDHEYSYRFRVSPEGSARRRRFSSSDETKAARGPRFQYGYVYFRQVPDRRSRRGYFQKSVVLISSRALVGLFSEMVATVAKAYFRGGHTALVAACAEACKWPAPEAGVPLRLHMLGRKVQIQLPGRKDHDLDLHRHRTQDMDAAPDHECLVPTHGGLNLYRCLQPLLLQAQHLWELVLCGEAILIQSPSPITCSRLVLASLSLISPLKYHGDYRPYFTIYDPDCQGYATPAEGRRPAAILGVTNPYFDQAFDHWPTKVRLGQPGGHNRPLPKSRSGSTARGNSPVMAGGRRPKRMGVVTSIKPLLEADSAYSKDALKAVPTTPAELAEAETRLRRQFSELTQTFLIPLEQYMSRLLPLKSSVSPFRPVPKLPDFNARDFLGSVSTALPVLQRCRRGNWLALYARFLRSPNFRGWLARRQANANAQLLRLYLESVISAPLQSWAAKRSEIEVVDVLMRIRQARVSLPGCAPAADHCPLVGLAGDGLLRCAGARVGGAGWMVAAASPPPLDSRVVADVCPPRARR